jgi:hypothetical protein
MAPLAMPRRAAGTCGSTVDAASTMMAPPASPDTKRQPKNQLTDSGNAQAAKASVANTIIVRSAFRWFRWRPSGRPTMAPAR